MADTDGYMRPCEDCGGTGTVVKRGAYGLCSSCDGSGIHTEETGESATINNLVIRLARVLERSAFYRTRIDGLTNRVNLLQHNTRLLALESETFEVDLIIQKRATANAIAAGRAHKATIKILKEENAQLRAEIDRAYELLSSLTDHWVSYEDMGSECVHCGADVHVARPTQHHDGCAYVAAMDALEARLKEQKTPPVVVEDCPRCDSCGIELGEDVGYYGPGMKWVDASVALYPWRGEYYCDGCLSEEFSMLRSSEEAGSITVFFGADELDMPDELVIIADKQEG